MNHRRTDAFSRQRIHVAGTDLHAACLFCLPAHTVPVRSQQCVRAGRADHDQGRLYFQKVDNLTDRLWDALQVASGDKICLIHLEIEETVLILRHAADL